MWATVFGMRFTGSDTATDLLIIAPSIRLGQGRVLFKSVDDEVDVFHSATPLGN